MIHDTCFINQTKPGLIIFALLLSLKAFRFVLKREFCAPGIEARGFIFGPPIALAIGAKFVPLRKPRKLPVEDSSLWKDNESSNLLLKVSVCSKTGVEWIFPHEPRKWKRKRSKT